MTLKNLLGGSTTACIVQRILINCSLRSTALIEKDITFYPQIFESEQRFYCNFLRECIPFVYYSSCVTAPDYRQYYNLLK